MEDITGPEMDVRRIADQPRRARDQVGVFCEIVIRIAVFAVPGLRLQRQHHVVKRKITNIPRRIGVNQAPRADGAANVAQENVFNFPRHRSEFASPCVAMK